MDNMDSVGAGGELTELLQPSIVEADLAHTFIFLCF